MRPKLIPALVMLAVCGAFALTGIANASGAAKTRVTITAVSDGFFGYVKSTRPAKCSNNRKVKVLKQLGSQQNPRTDQKVFVETAQKQGTRYRWDTGTSGHMKGKFYAHVNRIQGVCKGDSSPSVRMP